MANLDHATDTSIQLPTEFSSEIRDHLHVRGEYKLDELTSENETGSPPHAWRIH